MSTDARPALVVFDVNETLADLSGLRPRFTAVDLPADRLPLWFARVLRDGFALAVAGGYRSFADLAAAHLRGLADDDEVLTDDAVQHVLGGMAELDVHPDVAPALRRLREAGVRVATLTNGSASNTASILDRAGVREDVEQVLSVDAVRRWKPAPEPYRYAVETCGVEPGEAVLVAAHGWDTDGARGAGLRTAFVRRVEPLSPHVARPDVLGADLEEVVARLLVT